MAHALDIALQVGSALAAAHKSGVLHRDIKPENIMLRPDGYVKVLDFGIAKLSEQEEAPPNAETRVNATAFPTQSGLVFGTARYMSPEQAGGQIVDARTDIWSFGVVLYEMLAGHPPFEGDAPSDCIGAELKTEPPPLTLAAPRLSVRLEEIVLKALRKKKEKRYQSMEGLLADLRRLKEVSESTASGWKPQAKTHSVPGGERGGGACRGGPVHLPAPDANGNEHVLAGNASAPGYCGCLSESSIAVLPV